MKEIYQAFRSAGVGEMEAIKVTDSFNDIIKRFNKESAESKARFNKESAESKIRSIKLDRDMKINRLLNGLILAFVIGAIASYVASIYLTSIT